jgi:hypothetical protein
MKVQYDIDECLWKYVYVHKKWSFTNTAYKSRYYSCVLQKPGVSGHSLPYSSTQLINVTDLEGIKICTLSGRNNGTLW